MKQGEFGRFADPVLLILVSLASGAKHGYAMMEDVASFSDVNLGPGTLYGALARLEERNLIEALPAEDRRRPYRLTDQGKAFLHGELARWERITTSGFTRLAEPQ
jgi:DNA-binding PadR family transcriptional regulator